jgi:hypothetical protein
MDMTDTEIKGSSLRDNIIGYFESFIKSKLDALLPDEYYLLDVDEINSICVYSKNPNYEEEQKQYEIYLESIKEDTKQKRIEEIAANIASLNYELEQLQRTL